MIKVLTQSQVLVNDIHIQRLSQRGPYASMSDAATAVRDIIGSGLTGGFADDLARQVATELLARRLIRLDPVGSEIAMKAHLAQALNGASLHPAIVTRILALGPFDSIPRLEIALAIAVREVYGHSGPVSVLHALAHDLAQEGVFEMTTQASQAA